MPKVKSHRRFKNAWNKRQVIDRVLLAKYAGLPGKKGSAAWEDLEPDERETLTLLIVKLASEHKENHFRRETERINKAADRLGVSSTFMKEQPIWIQECRAPTSNEFQDWARNQHEKSCKRYEPAIPISKYNGQCANFREFHRPCTSFFSHTGICETGTFEPERIHVTKWSDFQKMFRKAERKVKKQLGGI